MRNRGKGIIRKGLQMSLDELAPNVTSSSDEDNLGSILSNRKLSHNPEVYSGNSVRV
jgi:hypothetical protein